MPKHKQTDDCFAGVEDPRLPDISSDGSEKVHYDNPDFLIFCRKNYLYANSTFPGMSLHWHADVEFIYVVRGRIGYQLNGSKVIMKAGEGIFVNSKQLHVIVSEDSDCLLYCLIFHPMILCSSKYIEENFVAPVIFNSSAPYLLLSNNVKWQGEILRCINEMYDLSVCRNSESEMMQKLFELWTALYRNMDKSEPLVRYDGSLDAIKRMIHYIHDMYTNRIMLDDLCSAGGVGRTNCAKLFEKYTGCTPIDYVINYRISKSTELLVSTDMAITRIALEVGFSSASFFAETFRKKIGVTPQEFRKAKEKP